MRRLPALPLALACLLCAAGALKAQIPLVTIVPSGGLYAGGTQVPVTIEYCSTNGYFDGPPGVVYNGFDYAGFGSYAPGYRAECVDFGTWTGTVTIEEGQNTLHTFIMAALYGEMTAVYTTPPPEPPPAPPPVVTPDVEPMAISPTLGATYRFEIYNSGPDPRTFSLATSCSGSVSGCAVQSSISLLASQTGYVVVTYNVAGALNAAGTVQLTVTDAASGAYDTGSLSVKVAPSGPVIERGLCLTIAAGTNAAYECGDLRLVHPLPSVRTLGRERTPTLVYNSQHAHPFPLIHADVTIASWEQRPDSIRVTLLVNGTQRDRRSWAGSQWGATGQTVTRRIVTGFNGSADSTGLYSYQLEVGKVVSNNYTAIRTESGTLPIVNRSNSPFGAGWWLAGFEQLKFLAGGAVLWIGGDGSLRRYEQAGTIYPSSTVYLATPVDGPDSLIYDGGWTYNRHLKGGGQVLFLPNGFHIHTVDRLGYSTDFLYDENNRLATINIPPSGSGLSYTFSYGGSILQSVSVPDSALGTSRLVTIAASGSRIWRITDLSKPFVEFSFDGSYPNRIVARRDTRTAQTSYSFDVAGRLWQSSLTVPGVHTIARTFCSADVRGWAACAASLPHPDSAYTDYDGPRTDSADVWHFLTDPYGGVRQVRDPYGYVTSIARTDPRWPALVTRVQSANGRIVAARYDRRGNLASTTDSSRYYPGDNPTTQYAWDQTWDQLTQITLPNGQIAQFGVDANNGNRLWVQDGRGLPSRTTVQYYSSGNGAGLPSAVILPGGAQTSITYDVRGNPATVQTPLSLTTYYQNDPLGRTTLVRSPIGSGQYREDSTSFDRYGRAVHASSWAPAHGGAQAQLLTASSYYDDEDNLYRVERSQWPNPTGLQTLVTQRVFDAANRPTVEIAPDGYRDSTWYDPAGNVTGTKTRRGHVIAMAYDRMNRLRQRAVPAVTYPQRTGPGYFEWLILSYDGYSGIHPYPWFPNAGNGGLRIDSLIDTFAYDSVGNLILADNADARVRRTYFKDGSLQTDSLWIRNYSSSTFGHVYGLRYTYDVNGRPTALRHPSQLASGTGMRDSVRYVYDGTTGALASVYSLLGNPIQFLYNARGELIRTSMPGGITDSLAYDSLGRLTLDRIRNQSNSPTSAIDSFLRNTVLSYDDPLRVSAARNDHGWKDTVTASYSGLGHLALLTYARPQNIADSSLYIMWRQSASRSATFDPLGNAYSTYSASAGDIGWGNSFSGGSTGSSYFHNTTGRADSSFDAGGRYAFVHDSAGNTVFVYQGPYGSTVNDRASFYGADGRLRVAEWREAWGNNGNWTDPKWQVVFEEYRYDALGRRVLVMSRQGCWLWAADSTTFSDCQVSRVRRTVWDGARELWEIQMPARTQDSLLVENDPATVTYWAGAGWNGDREGWSDPNPLFGRVAYTYAGGVDQPVSLTRLGLVRRKSDTDIAYFNPVELRPHWNWRGGAEIGTFADGSLKTCTDGAHCVAVQWRGVAFAVGLASELLWEPPYGQTPYGWFGTLIIDKVDGTGTHYRRNRYVDPATGRFTQEDPIGLAGGLNLYGFASGDPVNFSDPFGLCPKHLTGRPCVNVLAGAEMVVRTDINSGFGRFTDRVRGAHQGVDIVSPAGAGVSAADRGVVEYVGKSDSRGSFVVVRHENDAGDVVSYTAYMHLQSVEVGVGQSVAAGERIARSGTTGYGPRTPQHLHFEIWNDLRAMGRTGLDYRENPAYHLDLKKPRGQ